MKKLGVWITVAMVLAGCANADEEIGIAMALRSKLLKASVVSFDARVTADYGDEVYQFSMSCSADSAGDLDFKVTEPETIRGITGMIREVGGELTFGDTALAFPLMADEQLSPVSAPWIFLKTLRSGYLTSAGKDGDQIRLSIDDSFEDDALHLDIWLDGQSAPVRAEILFGSRRILTVEVANFQIG